MNVALAQGWNADLDRGPGWLFMRLHGSQPLDAEGLELASRVCQLLENEFANRIVLEMDDVELLRSALIGELVRLHRQISLRDGMMRICGLSDNNYEVLCTSRLQNRFPRYRDREEAVMGYRPLQPR
jgi:anti-anti-sigma factor